MRPLPRPFDRLAAGLEAEIDVAGSDLLTRRMLTKDLAFPLAERDAFGLRGLLPDRVMSIEEQVELEVEHLRRKDDELEQYIGLAALQDRNATLFYRVLAEHVEEFLPVVYTPTVGRACQEYSHILRRTRGLWITPDDVDRVPELLRHAPYVDVRLIVVTDNERILGLGDQGAGGMAIPIGKLALYTAACGIHPALTLPVSLDVGTDNETLLADPLYIGHREPRLRGAAYDALVEAFVDGTQEVWPGCLIQWEDFKGTNALRILDRYRDRAPSFNDDIQGTAAVVVAGVIAGARALGRPLADTRVVLAGAGAAGIGIARLLRQALVADGLDEAAASRAIVLVDSRGLVHVGRSDLDDHKRALAASLEAVTDLGLASDEPPGLEAVVRGVRPTVLVGTTGIAGAFPEAVIRAAADGVDRPIILPLSNPTSLCEAAPARHPALDRRPGHHRDRLAVPLGPDRRGVAGDRAGEQRVRVPGPRPRDHCVGGERRHRRHGPRRGPSAGRLRQRRAPRRRSALPTDSRPAIRVGSDRPGRGAEGGRRGRRRVAGRRRPRGRAPWRGLVAGVCAIRAGSPAASYVVALSPRRRIAARFFGFHLPNFTFPGAAPEELFPRFAELATTAEAEGFDMVSVMDHFYQIGGIGPEEDPMMEGYSTLAALAARTNRVRLATVVTGVTYRNPALLAKTVTTLDVISGGRAILGIGAAWNEDEHQGYGFEFPPIGERMDRLDEALTICRLMFTEDRPSFEGRHFRIERALNSPRPLQPGGPRIMVGGGGEQRTLRIAAKHADMTNWLGTVEVMLHKNEVLLRHCEAEGRDPATIVRTVTFPMLLAETEKEAKSHLEEVPMHRRHLMPPGTPEMAADFIRPYIDAGFEAFIFRTVVPTTPEAVRLAGEVARLLR